METPATDTEYRNMLEWMYTLAPSFQVVGAQGYHPGLETMRAFASLAGQPHLSYKVVHIAGTNGKGSVAHMCAAALSTLKGRKVGLYTSPHLLDFRERIKIVQDSGFYEISKSQVLSFLNRYRDFIEQNRPSFFEITTLMAFDFFRTEGVDIAVIEAGLGGRLDSTNIVQPQVSVITSIGLDHKDILGDTEAQIAAEKAGIIKPGTPVVVGEMSAEALESVRRVASAVPAVQLHQVTERSFPLAEAMANQADLQAEGQVQNIRTVLTVLEVMGLPAVVPGSEVYSALIHAARLTGLHGRWERLSQTPEVICDIGHNPQALSRTMPQLERLARGRRLIVVFGMARDKDVYQACRLLPDGEMIFTQARGSRAMPAGELCSAALQEREFTCSPEVVPQVEAAVKRALKMAAEKDVIFIGGSSYVVAEALEYFAGKTPITKKL